MRKSRKFRTFNLYQMTIEWNLLNQIKFMKDRAKYDINANWNSKAQYKHAQNYKEYL